MLFRCASVIGGALFIFYKRRMKMKKIICVFLAFVLVLGLTACGKDEEATAENPTEGVSESNISGNSSRRVSERV